MYEDLVIGAYYATKEAQREKKAFIELCSLLPKDKAEKMMEDRMQRLNDEKKHREALAVAKAGRSLNFWGNR